MKFIDKLLKAARRNNSRLCIGLDPDPGLMPETSFLEFNKAIVDATADLVCAYKPNLAFYEALGVDGFNLLQRTVEHIPAHIPIIGDGKRGDIGNTAKAYTKALFITFGFDAATVNPYLGFDSVEPFTEYKDKGVFILCRTSNPGAMDFQSLVGDQGMPLYEAVARKAKEWNVYGNIGLVVGATYPEELRCIRQLCPEMLLLIPGIGAQGGDLASAVKYGVDARGEKAIIAVSRQILYASCEADFAEAARRSAQELRDKINYLVSQISS
ncbi:MAG TPA: orotidine-5'-phosphate decarboxylase [Dehalococcoidia bacterium]|nr:orotidine-5'-phosphate decarboxylase [Dehalococcoidia bacterium]